MMPRDPVEPDTLLGQDAQELFLLRLRYKEGRFSEVGANKSFLLDDAASVWMVYTGKVDVFAVQVHDREPMGPRHHLLRVGAGQILIGMDLEKTPRRVGLLAVGTVGTGLIKIKRSRFIQLAEERANTEILATRLDEWVTGLAHALADGVPPKDCRLLEPNQETTLDAKTAFRPPRGVLWICPVQGQMQYMGKADLVTGDGFFPVSKDVWLETIATSHVSALATEEYISQDKEWSGLEHYHTLLLNALVLRMRQAAEAESEFLRRRKEADRAAVQRGLSQLVSILQPERDRFSSSGAVQDPLFTVCQLVGKAAGIAIQPPPRSADRAQRDPIGEIAHASRIRYRQILLKGDWWLRDSGPLVGFLGENGRPVALVPLSPSRYELYDPIEQTRTKVTAAVAAKLSPSAYMFYPSFQTEAVGVRALWQFGFRITRRDLGMIVLMGMMAGLLGMAMPYATGLLIDTVIPNAQRGQLFQIVLALVAIAIANVLFDFTRSVALLRVEGKLDSTLQAAVWDRLLTLPAPFFRQFTAGDLAMRGLGINTIRQLLTGTAMNTLLAALFSIFNLLLLFVYSFQLALAALVIAAVLVGVTSAATIFQIRLQRLLVEQQGMLSGVVFQLITGISKLRVAAAEGRAFSVWAERFSDQKKTALMARTTVNQMSVFNSVTGVVTSMAIFGMIAATLQQSSFSVGSFVAFNSAFSQFLTAMLSMSSTLFTILAIIPTFERLKPILLAAPEVNVGKADPGYLNGGLEVSHISFRYTADGPIILKDVSVRAEPGEFIAIVGPTGSGKSTLFRMLLGFEKPDAGAVYYDGQDLQNLNVNAVRRQMGVVLQNARLMSGDLLTNIVGASRLTVDDAWEAARMVGLDDDIQQMPMGMFTIITEGGSNISGGQRQRILIARAIINKPRILFFDEATSALDNITQEKVNHSLESLQATRVVIAHRLSTIVHADRIYVLANGELVQSGTYAELVGKRGLFADLARRQLA